MMTELECRLGIDNGKNMIGRVQSAEDEAEPKECPALLGLSATMPRERAHVDIKINAFLNQYFGRDRNHS
jgi:hypothetical protein